MLAMFLHLNRVGGYLDFLCITTFLLSNGCQYMFRTVKQSRLILKSKLWTKSWGKEIYISPNLPPFSMPVSHILNSHPIFYILIVLPNLPRKQTPKVGHRAEVETRLDEFISARPREVNAITFACFFITSLRRRLLNS